MFTAIRSSMEVYKSIQLPILQIDQFKTNNNKNIYQHNFKSFNQQIFLENIPHVLNRQ